MIPVKDAQILLRQNRPQLGHETIRLSEAYGRILSKDIIATLDMPLFPTANMDGYAAAACTKGDQLTIIGEAAAGHAFKGNIRAGEAIKISTGAAVPKGAERVLVKEECRVDAAQVIINVSSKVGDSIRSVGSDFRKGDILLSTGTRLSAPNLSLCASNGLTKIEVVRKPKIAMLSSGDELQQVGANLGTDQIYDANTIGIAALLRTWGAEVTVIDRVSDNKNHIMDTLSGLSDFDIIVPIGGASVGDHDLMQSRFKAAGFDFLYSKIAMRPGKPCWAGRNASQIVIGLPGNPASAFVCAQIFLRVILGFEPAFLLAKLAEKLEENGPRETYLRAKVEIVEGQIFVLPLAHQDSYRLRPQSDADALIRIPSLGGPYDKGDSVEIHILNDDLSPS